MFLQNLMEAVGLRILLLTDHFNPLNLDGLPVDDISTKIMAESTQKLYQCGKNQALSKCFSVFSVRILGGEYQLLFNCRSCMNKQLLSSEFMSFTLNLKNKVAKFPSSSRNIYKKYLIYKEIVKIDILERVPMSICY